MQDDEVKALAEKLGEVEIDVAEYIDKHDCPRYELSPMSLEALARVALEYVEERERERTNPSATNETKLYRRIKCGSCGEYVFREEQP